MVHAIRLPDSSNYAALVDRGTRDRGLCDSTRLSALAGEVDFQVSCGISLYYFESLGAVFFKSWNKPSS